MKTHRILSLLLSVSILILPLSACRSKQSETPSTSSDLTPDPSPVTEMTTSPDEMFTSRDLHMSYDADSAIQVALHGDTATVGGEGSAMTDGVLRIDTAGVYLLRGELDGMIEIAVSKTDKVQIILDGVTVRASGIPAIYVVSADKVFVTLAEGSANSLAVTGAFSPIGEENVDAALYSKETLTIGGEGSLTVSCESGHGILSKDDLKITGGDLTVKAASHAIKANDSIRICGGELDLTAGKDGLHAENADDAKLGFVYLENASIEAIGDGDGIDASGYAMILNSDLKLTAGGGAENGEAQGDEGFFPGHRSQEDTATDSTTPSRKGISAVSAIQISGGRIEIDSADDAIHGDQTVLILDGTHSLKSGDDGIHAEGTLEIRGGSVTVSESYEGLEGASVLLSGGEVTVYASDDGINATGSASGSAFDPMNGMPVAADASQDQVTSDERMGGMPGEPPSDLPGGNQGGFPGGDMGGGRPGGDMGGNMGGGRPGGDMGGMPGGTSDAALVITGGTHVIHAEGDGVDSNGIITVSGGDTRIYGPTSSGNGALDYQTSASITGGSFLAVGASGMAMNFSEATQGSVLMNVQGIADCTLTLARGGETLYTAQIPKAFTSVLLSVPELTVGQEYTLTVGDQVSGFTLDSLIYGASGGGMMPGGDMGGGKPGGQRPGGW